MTPAALLLAAGLTEAPKPVQPPSAQPVVVEGPVLGEPRWVVPSPNLPAGVTVQASNNNVAITLFQGRLFMAWRSAPIHFASTKAVMNIVSSGDMGKTWGFEHKIALGCDVREPFFLEFNGALALYYIQNGTNPAAFEPKGDWRILRGSDGRWGEPEIAGENGEIHWEMKVRGGRAYRTSYIGNHYDMTGASNVELRFETTDDGLRWRAVDPRRPAEFIGGSSECAFEFASDGSLWAVTRNEDGDSTGFGSMVARAAPGTPGDWKFPGQSSPDRFDSPRMFRHGDELYLVARRDVGGKFDQAPAWLPFKVRRIENLLAYWRRPKRTALYRIDQSAGKVVHLFDLPSAGDTAFPSIVQTGPDSFLIANYTSPVSDPNRSWVSGQISPEGTSIYLIELRFPANH
jgi:hypothetical protein